MYTYRQKIINLCIDLKSINEDRLRTHVQNADPFSFLMFYLTTSLSAPWTRALLHAYTHTHTHTRTHAQTPTQTHIHTHTHTRADTVSFTHLFTLALCLSLSTLLRSRFLPFSLSRAHTFAHRHARRGVGKRSNEYTQCACEAHTLVVGLVLDDRQRA